jgi:hypothetical protein
MAIGRRAVSPTDGAPPEVGDASPGAPLRPDVDAVVRSLVRARAVLVALAIALPAGCFGLFERQARRLDALAEDGVVVTATVTALGGAGAEGSTSYAYEVDGVRHAWSVRRDEAPHDVGATFPIVVSRRDPSLSLPGADRSIGAARAAETRAFGWKVEAGLLWFLGANALFAHLRLRRIRRTRLTDVDDPVAYRRRLALGGAMLAPMIGGIVLWHAGDATRRGESLWPVAIAGVLGVAIAVGTGAYVLREGRGQAGARAARLMRWAVPLAVAIAALRLVVWLAARP